MTSPSKRDLIISFENIIETETFLLHSNQENQEDNPSSALQEPSEDYQGQISEEEKEVPNIDKKLSEIFGKS